MEERVYAAAFEGNAGTLNQLLQQDPFILEKATLKWSDKTPLHIAAMLGHVDFARAILNFSSDMCLARDRDGRNPLHLAAIKGKLGVLEVLIHARPLAAREKTDNGGTILHLCVKYNQLETLKMLVENIRDPEFLNAKNYEGMTILHLAVLDQKIETTSYLVDKNMDVNAKNADGNTALDIIARNSTNSEIETFLRNSEALRAEEINRFSTGHVVRIKGSEWLDKKRDAIMVAASLIATMAFQAGVTPAGGVWQDDLFPNPQNNPPVSQPHGAGEAIMAYHHPKYYRNFIRCNTIAFVSSLSTILLLISGLPFKRRFFLWFLTVIMWLTITSVALTYGISILMVTPREYRNTLGHITDTAVTVWCGLMSLLLLGNTIRLVNRWLKSCGINIWKPRWGNSAVQDQKNGRQVFV